MNTHAKPVVALSSTYGAGGVLVGARVAEALQVPFLDQLWSPADLAQALRQGSDRAYITQQIRGDLAVDDVYEQRAVHMLASRQAVLESDERVVALHSEGGVVLGRAAPFLLREASDALRVLLDGPLEARLAAGAAQEGVDAATALERQRAADASRRQVAAQFYGADPDDPRQYHLIIDTTAVGLDAATDLIIMAARAFRGFGA